MNSINNIENNFEELYNDLFAYRVMIQDFNENESFIIKEFKIYLLQKRYDINNINNIIFDFYNYFLIDIEFSIIEDVRIFLLNDSENQLFNIINNRYLINNVPNELNNVPNELNNIDNTDDDNIDNTDDDNIENDNRLLINIPDNQINNDIINEYREYNLNNFYNIISQFIGISERFDRFDDVVISLDNEDLKNLKTYNNISTVSINCCICLDNIKEDEIICELNCNHKFHETCIKNYLDKYNYKCPICRESVGNTKANI
jgi:hypothetical protein